MRICIFCRCFHPHIGGNETQALILAKQLIAHGVKVIVITGRTFDSYPKYEIYEGIEIYRVNEIINQLGGIVRLVKKVILLKNIIKKTIANSQNTNQLQGNNIDQGRLIKIYSQISIKHFEQGAIRMLIKHKDKYDIIHSQMLGDLGPIAFKGAMKVAKPILIKDASLGGLEKIENHNNRLKEQLRKKAYYVAISSKIEENLKSQDIAPQNIFNIYNGIESSNIELKNNKSAMPNTILYVGNFWQGPIKGLDVLIRAIGEVVKTNKEITVNIAGQGNINTYRELAKECGCLDQVKFLGQTKDMDALYRSNSIFILPSRQEGMSNATLEAMSYGMPCIVTDVSGSSDQIDNNINGIITPIEDYQAMAQAIRYMLNNPEKAQQMGNEAKRKIREVFDIKVTAQQHIDVYKKILTVCQS